MDTIKEYLTSQSVLINEDFKATLFRLSRIEDREKVQHLIKENSLIVYDQIYEQLKELIKSLYPFQKLNASDYEALINKHLGQCPLHEYGVWAYYSWSNKLIHILDEDEFVEVRTNRNRYKITREEQQVLKSKKIGIVGLSVGQSIALTMAMERACGELRLADFDTAELSNLNRIRTGLHNLGLNKTIIAAREIAEIDPYINVSLFKDGLSESNMNEFFTGNGKLDLLVEVCDGLDIKIQSRFKARSLQIPVVMDTNDRGMVDVERFDLEPQRPILHGLAGDLDPQSIKDLSNEDKIPYVLKMVGIETISSRLKASMMEIEQSINSWPQLASSVTLGGAVTTDVSRRILLDQYHDSGRYYIDPEEIICDKEIKEKQRVSAASLNPYKPLDWNTMEAIVQDYLKQDTATGYALSEDELNGIMDAAIIAPSAGNNQPWKWYYKQGALFLFHDKHKSYSWGDYFEMGSHLGLGAAIENVHLQAKSLGLIDEPILMPLTHTPNLIAVIRFKKAGDVVKTHFEETLIKNLFTRCTNRKLSERKIIPASFYTNLQAYFGTDSAIQISYIDDEASLHKAAAIIAACDRIRMLNPLGHEEFFSEVRWNKEDAEHHRDGIDLSSVELKRSQVAAFTIANDWNAVKLLAKWKLGSGFEMASKKAVWLASSLVLVTVNKLSHLSILNSGRAMERAWIYCNAEGYSVHPMLSPVFFFNRLVHGNAAELNKDTAKELQKLRKDFCDIFPILKSPDAPAEVFLMKLSVAEDMGIKSMRKFKDELFHQG
jgi:molybdopterin/thiamine biosynthesis adenylyltransferase/nitroreductase